MRLIGHRGAAGEAPENTLGAFRHAQRLSLFGWECDIRLSADGELVMLHDATVDRTTDAAGPVSSFTVEQLRCMKAMGRFPDWPDAEGIPTLAEALAATPAMTAYVIEIKADAGGAYARIAEGLSAACRHAGVSDRVIAISFQAEALAALRRVDPGLQHGLLGSYASIDDVETAVALGCAFACPGIATVDAAVAAAARERGLRLSLWTCNTPDEWQAALALQAYAVTTDYPTQALAWHAARDSR